MDSPHSLEATSEQLASLLLDAPIPSDLDKAIRDAWNLTSKGKNPGDDTSALSARWAVRSSAVGEDGAFSFAGQFKTVLNVDPRNLGQAYKEVIASKYSPNALFYRVKNGFLDQETPMAVLVLEMIDAEASGIVYSRSPVSSGSTATTVYSVWGLGEHLVKGATAPDVIEVSREEEGAARVIRKEPRGERHEDGYLEGRTRSNRAPRNPRKRAALPGRWERRPTGSLGRSVGVALRDPSGCRVVSGSQGPALHPAIAAPSPGGASSGLM